MRNIIFRGKSLETGYWVFGYYFIGDDNANNPFRSSPIKTKHYIRYYHAGDWNLGMWIDEEVDPLTIGQYTGIDDTDGLKIFEGDKCHLDSGFDGDFKVNEYIGTVVFDDGCFYIIGAGEVDSALVSNRNVRVIGNKYN